MEAKRKGKSGVAGSVQQTSTQASIAALRKKRVSSAPENETKEARFIRLAKVRVSKVIGQIRGIGKLASANYAFTEDQVKKIEAALDIEIETVVDRLRARLAGGGMKASGPVFDL